MTKEQIEKRALELYPINPYPVQCKDFNRVVTVDINETQRNAYIAGYNEALEQTTKALSKEARNKILDSLPKWKRAELDIYNDSLDYVIKITHDGGDYSDWEECIVTNRVKKDEYYIDISDLVELGNE